MVSQTTQLPTGSPDVGPPSHAAVDRQLLTVNVEDYFQVGAFQKFISTDNWYRFESRLQQNVETVLELLERHNTKATFFVLGWTATKEPVLIRQIVDAGHEVASRGYLHQPLLNLTDKQIRADIVESKSLLEDVTGQRVDGFRLSDGWLNRRSLWLLDELAAAGYRYDSSLMPKQSDFANDPQWRHIRTVETKNGPLVEVPLSTMQIPGGWLPIAGGNYQRQVPDFLMKRLVDRAVANHNDPFVMYFQVWELDEQQPELSVADRLTKIRHYRKLGKYRRILPQYLQRYDFTSIRSHALLDGSPLATLKHDTSPKGERELLNSPNPYEMNAPSLALRAGEQTATSSKGRESFSGQPHPVGSDRQTEKDSGPSPHTDKTAVTLIIPCFNEEKSVSYLANTLRSVTEKLSGRWAPRIIFVDDCSTDDTFNALHTQFKISRSGSRQDVPREEAAKATETLDEFRYDVKVIRHDVNRGVSAAILTGIEAAETDIVASMDCDCSYDPHELASMLPLLTDDVAMVTASPYHKDGLVRNVPNWRLFLSRGLSSIYQRLLKQPLATWTSCFRIYRRKDILDLPLQEDGFLGTAELAAQLVMKQRRIVEHPATLEVRLFGLSKMKTFKAILSHLKLLLRIVGEQKRPRLEGTDAAANSPEGTTAHSRGRHPTEDEH